MTKKQAELERQIAATNRKFKKASPAKKRVMIAQDVLDNIRIFTPVSGIYLDTTANLDSQIEKIGETTKSKTDGVLSKQGSQKLLYDKSVLKSCEMCAIGSCFVAAVRLGDNHELETQGEAQLTDFGFRRIVGRYFSKSQQTLIEEAFEGWTPEDEGGRKAKTPELWRDYANGNYSNEESRRILRDIMKNIVKNKGTFIP